jgi:hypothetical protein
MDSEVGGRGQLQELTECPVFIVEYAFGGHGIRSRYLELSVVQDWCD